MKFLKVNGRTHVTQTFMKLTIYSSSSKVLQTDIIVTKTYASIYNWYEQHFHEEFF